MSDIFKAELLRFRWWAAGCVALQLVVLGFLTRVIDMAQQPIMVYQVFGAVYAAVGLLLGLYQMGGYRRPNTWLNLLHRPIAHWRIAAALFGAGVVLLAVAILLPLLVIAGWQEGMTARVVDMRHVWLIVSALLVSVCGYLAGGYLMLADRRMGFSAVMFLAWLALTEATGVGAVLFQLVLVAWLAAMVLIVFKPALGTPERDAPRTFVVAAPMATSAVPSARRRSAESLSDRSRPLPPASAARVATTKAKTGASRIIVFMDPPADIHA